MEHAMHTLGRENVIQQVRRELRRLHEQRALRDERERFDREAARIKRTWGGQ